MGNISLDLWILFWEPFSLSAGSAGGSISEEIFLDSWRVKANISCVRLLSSLFVAGCKGAAILAPFGWHLLGISFQSKLYEFSAPSGSSD